MPKNKKAFYSGVASGADDEKGKKEIYFTDQLEPVLNFL